MVEEAHALAQILEAATPLDPIQRPLLDALGNFLSAPLRSAMPHPRFDNSTVDGYAVRAEDGLTERRIAGEQAAGLDRSLHLQVGEAIRIFTGAPMPKGSNAVVMQEDVSIQNGFLISTERLQEGENVRKQGADLAEGQIIGSTGDRITPQMIGLLASQGFSGVPVYATPKVAILSTGNELRPAGEPLSNGQIYESNAPMLSALLQTIGIRPETDHVADDQRQIEIAVSDALTRNHVLILSGGVSVGEHDHVKPALAALGIPLALWRIRMKPGKPFMFARIENKLIFGLPGNPVSAFVTFLVLVRPALLQILGAQGADRFLLETNARIARAVENPDDRPHYLRGILNAGEFVPSGLQQSHALFHLARSDALLRLDSGKRLAAGEQVKALVW